MKKLFVTLLALISLFSCQKSEDAIIQDFDDSELFATIENLNATRTSMDENNNVLWSEDDQIVAFMKTTLPVKYQIMEPFVGSTTGGFNEIVEESGNNLYTGVEIYHNVVLYPYSTDVGCMKNDNSNPTKSYKLNVVLPQTQHYAKNSFGNGSFPMAAVSSSRQFTFKNVCGGVKLQLKGVDKIKSIKLEGLAEELISGKSTVVCYADGSAPSITMHSTKATKTVTLECGEAGVQLNETTPTTFILAVPPVTFASGMKITITDTDGMSKTFTNRSSNTITRSNLLTFPTITYKQEGVVELPEGSLASNEVTAEGGTIDIPIVTNQDYEVVIPEAAADWIRVVSSKALREETITLSVDANNTTQARSAEVLIATTEGVTLQSITICQEAGDGIADLSANGTANCYLIKSAGSYKFKAVKGNSTTSAGSVSKAEVLWESFGTNVKPQVGDLVATAEYRDGYVYFSTPETFANGNASIAVKDANGTILWSWHIWCSEEGWTDQEYAYNTGTMMDRNLGATSATPGDVGALGLLYQWGRKDPFMGSSSISASTLAASTGKWSIVSEPISVSNTTANPMTFYGLLGEWSATVGQIWNDSEKTIYDPCPVGYKVPEGGEDSFWKKAIVVINPTIWDSSNQGIYWKLTDNINNNSTAWYPAAGYRLSNGGGLTDVGSYGFYFSSTRITGNNNLYAYSLGFGNSINTANQSAQRYGCSVRCIREEN